MTMPDADALVRPLPLGPLPETPLVSVLVANYNYAGYVAAAVESALAQTYRHLEVVVCDDGSTDDSLAVLHALAERDGRVRVVAQENGGQASALNGAYAAARGDILCVLDADDVYEPEKVAATVEGFRAHPEAGFLIHNVVVIDGEGRVRGRKQEHEAMPAGWLAPRVLALGGPLTGLPPASGLSLRRPVAAHLFPLDPAYRSLADGLVKAGAPVLTPVVALPQVLARFRIHGANLTSAASGSVAARRKVLGVIRRHHAYIRGLLAKHHGPEAAAQLRPVEFNPAYGVQLAQLALLEPAPQSERRAAVDALLSNPGAVHVRHRWFYRLAASLPLPAGLVRLAFGDSPLKRAAQRLDQWARGVRS